MLHVHVRAVSRVCARSFLTGDGYLAILESGGSRPSTVGNTAEDAARVDSRFHKVPPMLLRDVTISPLGINGGKGILVQGKCARSQINFIVRRAKKKQDRALHVGYVMTPNSKLMVGASAVRSKRIWMVRASAHSNPRLSHARDASIAMRVDARSADAMMRRTRCCVA